MSECGITQRVPSVRALPPLTEKGDALQEDLHLLLVRLLQAAADVSVRCAQRPETRGRDASSPRHHLQRVLLVALAVLELALETFAFPVDHGHRLLLGRELLPQ